MRWRDKNNESKNLEETIRGALQATALSALLWLSPMTISVGAWKKVEPLSSWITTSIVANAKEMASGSGSRVNKDPESLLRYGLPIKNKEVRKLQSTIETILLDIGSKRKTAALEGVKNARTILKSEGEKKLVPSCRSSSRCSALVGQMLEGLEPLEEALKASTNSLQGSDQEREALDKAYKAQNKLSQLLSDLEEQMIPSGYVTPVPEEYSDLPQLRGRATVEMVFEKPDKSSYFVEGTNWPQAKMTMIIDGYTAPVTAGNFVDLVQKGFYTKMPVQRSDGFVVQTGDPDGKPFGYVGTPSKSIGAGPNGERLIPNEIFVLGEKGPFYGSTVEDEGKGGQATVLPFSAYGAMGWARDEYDPNSGSSQFFWLLFDSDLTPAGKNVLDGRYPCFGYVVQGADFLRDIKEDDIIISANVISGAQNLLLPK